jgi:predicted metalloendopeptidase
MKLYFQQRFYTAILHYQADEAVNYGGIEVIGHEISHDLTIQDHDTMPKGI